jgi:hypothetical protein
MPLRLEDRFDGLKGLVRCVAGNSENLSTSLIRWLVRSSIGLQQLVKLPAYDANWRINKAENESGLHALPDRT